MQHRLEPALEIRIGKSIAEVVQREFRDWSRPGPVRMRHREAQRDSKHGSGRAFSVRSAPMSRGLTESMNGSPLADRLGSISIKASPSFLPCKCTHTIRTVPSKRRWLLPFQSVKKSRTDKPRPQQARQCRARPHPNRQKTSRHSSQTLRRRKWSRRMRLGFKRDLARNRTTRSWQAQLAKLPRVAGDNRSARRRREYESIPSFG